eukprot:g224.t1
MTLTTLNHYGLLLLVLASACAYDNGEHSRKPALGWNTWCTLSDCHNGDNKYFDRCNEFEVMSIADAMIDSGMHELGFNHVNLDDCWADMERDAHGNIQPDPARFPSGMKAVADKLHAMGLKFGLYTSMGDSTCNPGGRPHKIPGSFGHYKEDAATIASWNLDYVDWCGGHLTDPQAQHTNLSHWLNATGRPIWLELCRGYSYDPIPKYVAEVANSWRTTGDHQDEWGNTLKVIQSFWAPSNPGVPHAWNYGDFLMTGGPGCDVNASWHCPRSSDDEYRTAFATWAIAASPLIVATDIRNMTAVMKQCLLNKEAIEINQDYKMPAGKLVGKWGCSGDDKNACAVMSRPLSDGTHAALLSNLKDDKTHNITLPFEWLFGGTPLGASSAASMRDVLGKAELGTATGSFTASLKPHESILLRITPSM